MKRIAVTILVLFLSLSIHRNIFAQEATPSGQIDKDKVEDLKEKLATKVATLRENQKRGFYGSVAALSKTTFTLVTKNGAKNEIRVRLDEDVQVFDLGKTKQTKAITDLKSSQMVAVLGFYDDVENQLQARIIYLQTLPQYYQGNIAAIKTTEAEFSLQEKDEKEISFDYEKTTQAQEYNWTDQKIAKSGLSRLKEQDWLMVWANTPSNGDNYKAVRIFRFPSKPTPTPSGQNIQEPSPSSSPLSSPKPKSSPD